MFGEAPLSNATVLVVLRDVWALPPSDLSYAAVGYGSFHWLAAASDGSEWFVTADRADVVSPTASAYALTRELADAGLEFVRAPRRHSEGGVVGEADGWWISVWPWIDGRTATDHVHASAADLEATLRCVRRLHELSTIQMPAELVEDWAIAGRAQLMTLLATDHEEWGAGPYVAEVRSRVVANTERIEGLFARYDLLVESIRAAAVPFVITHGEPHAGNVVHTEAGPLLIDWDTVRWAPRERDLWSLTDYDGWRLAYGREVPLSDDALGTYRLQWTLVEIADFVVSLAAADETNPDHEVAVRELRPYLPLAGDGR